MTLIVLNNELYITLRYRQYHQTNKFILIEDLFENI